MRRTSLFFRATRTFLALAVVSVAGLAHAADTARTPAHTLTVEVCHPVDSNNCTRDRSVVLISEGSTVVLGRLSEVPYVQSVERNETGQSNHPAQHFSTYPDGFRLRLDTRQFEQDAVWVDYSMQDKGLVGMRKVTSGGVALNNPTTVQQEFNGRVELKAGVPAAVTVGFSTVTLTFDAR
jgi:hypothetical protein